MGALPGRKKTETDIILLCHLPFTISLSPERVLPFVRALGKALVKVLVVWKCGRSGRGRGRTDSSRTIRRACVCISRRASICVRQALGEKSAQLLASTLANCTHSRHRYTKSAGQQCVCVLHAAQGKTTRNGLYSQVLRMSSKCGALGLQIGCTSIKPLQMLSLAKKVRVYIISSHNLIDRHLSLD